MRRFDGKVAVVTGAGCVGPGWGNGRATADAPFRYVVETDVLPEREADFNAWYAEEHLAGLA